MTSAKVRSEDDFLCNEKLVIRFEILEISLSFEVSLSFDDVNLSSPYFCKNVSVIHLSKPSI